MLKQEIKVKLGTGVQKRLNLLAEKPGFKKIFTEEVEKRKLVPKDVNASLYGIYGQASKHAHGNHEPIMLREGDFTAGEIVVLISFFRLQEKWGNALKWEVVWKKGGH